VEGKMEEEKGFKVIDKRRIFKEEKKETVEKKEESLPPVNFSTFIVSLSSSALMHLGEIPDPSTGEYKKNLILAKQTIDILEMLKEKTKGNLDAEEEGLLNNILFDLRIKYVKQVKK